MTDAASSTPSWPPAWIDQFEGLARLEPAARQTLETATRVAQLPKGTRVFTPGQAPQSYLLLLAGDIRVSQVAGSGREIVLYRVQPGESCALTTACLLSDEAYQAEAIAETDISAAVIPRATFEALIASSSVFRHFVLTTFSHRITDLFKLVDEIAFQRMDVRLAHKLIERADGADTLHLTHQQIATELGTAREVVSRLVNEFQRRGWVLSTRGSMELTNRAALQRLASSS